MILKLYLSESDLDVVELFKVVAKRRSTNRRGWLSDALVEAMNLYLKKYANKSEGRKMKKKIKVNTQTKRVLRDFFSYVASFYRRLQPGLRRRLIYYFLEAIGITTKSTKYRYLRRMLELGLIVYTYTDYDGEPVYRIEWDEIFRLFPELRRPGIRELDRSDTLPR